ncbi:hypothetical protein CLI92_08340 [Vandammella animalimorsus]|uniref:Uncharacterized protein n=1 Tax=Vandammella animalimorsus TaxID=2029117 RepID=A0A2A2T4I8_9BURK|nr:hypothetical protein [Vandammella animalimorsus]PAT31366.1 hypothetical protein CK626_10195 [Vandammella animalimorsus]PAX16357.1 hypothetical protein CLI92_08340 [Vandammella animalimorsus]PAX18772.1 hypothetical protein CLI93_10420 [Vandammella animalimorsus]
MTESPLPGRADERADTPQAQEPSDAELQAFWKQALASAPAAGLAPGRLAALRQRILADAAHALITHALTAPGHVQPAASPSAWLRLRRAVQGLLHPLGRQPQWAAGLASVCMACLVLMIWYGRWPEAALEDRHPARQAPAPDSAAKPARVASQPAARPPQAPPQPEALPAPAYAPAPPASTATLQSEAAMAAQQAQSDAIAIHTQPHRQRNSFSASQTAAALAQPLAQATHWRWAGASGQDQAVAIPLSENVRTALQQILPGAQQPAAPTAAPQQAQRILLLHERQVLLQIWVAPGHMQWQPTSAEGLSWLVQPSADAYNRLMRALATDASQPKPQ